MNGNRDWIMSEREREFVVAEFAKTQHAIRGPAEFLGIQLPTGTIALH